ncbi:MAG TPA: hypothetical protein VL242_41470, partial [Sorangium sp.]|nr:hypothetical protein [Sorangium sp.]
MLPAGDVVYLVGQDGCMLVGQDGCILRKAAVLTCPPGRAAGPALACRSAASRGRAQAAGDPPVYASFGSISEDGWEADWAGDGGWGTPGQGGCGGRGGKGGENGYPSIGLVALHARVTVRDSEIETSDGGQGGDGGEPQRGGRGGRSAPGGVLE